MNTEPTSTAVESVCCQRDPCPHHTVCPFQAAEQVSAPPLPPNIIEIRGTTAVPLVTIKPDGAIEYGPNYTPDEAARTFWQAMSAYSPVRAALSPPGGVVQQPPADPVRETIAVRFDILHAYAATRGLEYNELCRTVRDAIADGSRAALSAPQQPSIGGWQPIETAPKDGSRVLLYHSGFKHPFYKRDLKARWWVDWWDERAWYQTAPDAQPTHWMPLPAAPNSESVAGDKPQEKQ